MRKRDLAKSTGSAIGRNGALSVGLASFVFAISGYVVLLLAAKILPPENNAIFIAYWSFLFLWFGVLSGVSIETTRAVYVGGPAATGVRVVGVGVGVGAAISVILLITSPWWTAALFGEGLEWLGIVLPISVALYSGQVAFMGALGGRTEWVEQAGVTGVDGLLRIAYVAVAAIFAASIGGFAIAASVGTATWLILVALAPRLRGAMGARVDIPTPQFLGNIGHASLAAAASSALIVGFPVLVRLSSPDVEFLASAPLLLAVSLTRAPLMIPLGAYQGVVVTHFLRNREKGLRPLATFSAVITLVGVFGAIAAAIIGPWLLEMLIGANYRVSGLVLAGLTLGATSLALLTVSGALVLALGRHRMYASTWSLASAISLGVLFIPLPLESRVVASLIVGPAVGAIVNTLILRADEGLEIQTHLGVTH